MIQITSLTKNEQGTSLDQLLLSKQNTKFGYFNSKNNKNEIIEVFYNDGNYIYQNKKYRNKEALRSVLANFLELHAKLDTVVDDAMNLKTSPEEEVKRKTIKKYEALKALRKKREEERKQQIQIGNSGVKDKKQIAEIQKNRMISKMKFWSNPIIQTIPVLSGGALIGLGSMGSFAIQDFIIIGIGIIVVYSSTQFIGKQLNKSKIRLEKIKKIESY